MMKYAPSFAVAASVSLLSAFGALANPLDALINPYAARDAFAYTVHDLGPLNEEDEEGAADMIENRVDRYWIEYLERIALKRANDYFEIMSFVGTFPEFADMIRGTVSCERVKKDSWFLLKCHVVTAKEMGTSQAYRDAAVAMSGRYLSMFMTIRGLDEEKFAEYLDEYCDGHLGYSFCDVFRKDGYTVMRWNGRTPKDPAVYLYRMRPESVNRLIGNLSKD